MQALALRRHLLQHQKLIEEQIQMGTHHEPGVSRAVKNQAVQLKQAQMQEGARLGDAVRTLDEQIKVHPFCMVACAPQVQASLFLCALTG